MVPQFSDTFFIFFYITFLPVPGLDINGLCPWGCVIHCSVFYPWQQGLQDRNSLLEPSPGWIWQSCCPGTASSIPWCHHAAVCTIHFSQVTFPSIPQAFQVDKPHLKNIPKELNKEQRQCRAVSALLTAPWGQKWFCWTLTRLVQLGSGILIKFFLKRFSVAALPLPWQGSWGGTVSLVPVMWSCAVWDLLATCTRLNPRDTDAPVPWHDLFWPWGLLLRQADPEDS